MSDDDNDENEERRNETIDRLGGKSRITQLEEQLAALTAQVTALREEAEEKESLRRLHPGAELFQPEAGITWLDRFGSMNPLYGTTYVLLGLGEDWAVIRDRSNSDLFFTCNDGIAALLLPHLDD